MRVLYVTYDGMTSLLGQSQVWPYLEGLTAAGHRFEVLSFEQQGRLGRIGDKVARDLEGLGIAWHRRPFRTRPPLIAKAIDLREMVRETTRLAASGRFDAIHARSSVAAHAARAAKRRHGLPFIFDIRGFWADERRDGGRWPDTNPLHRHLYRQWKAREDRCVAEAHEIVVVTEAARREIERSASWQGQPVTVIPGAIDHAAFPLRTPETRAAARARLGIGEAATVLVYLGTLSALYLPGEMLRFYARLRHARPGARFLFVGWHDHAELVATARARGLDIPAEEIVVQPAEHGEVPFWLAAADIAIALRKPSYSSLAISPVKLGEYFACGLPVIANEGIGDVAEIVPRLGAGAVLGAMSDDEIDGVLARLDDILAIDPATLRERSWQVYGMPVALERYAGVYQRLAATRAAAPA